MHNARAVTATVARLAGKGVINVLQEPLRATIETLLRRGVGQREIQRLTQVDRKTIRRYARSIGLSKRTTLPGHLR
jgi:hypothetical protein